MGKYFRELRVDDILHGLLQITGFALVKESVADENHSPYKIALNKSTVFRVVCHFPSSGFAVSWNLVP